MMEKLSAKEFDENFSGILEKLNKAAEDSNRRLKDISILAATKTVDADTINYAISRGINLIGENKVQELLSKKDQIIEVEKHFIARAIINHSFIFIIFLV